VAADRFLISQPTCTHSHTIGDKSWPILESDQLLEKCAGRRIITLAEMKWFLRGAQSNFDLAANAPNLSLSEAGLHNLVHAVFKAPQGSQLVSGVLSLHSRSPANLPAIKFNVHASLLVHIILNSHNIGKWVIATGEWWMGFAGDSNCFFELIQ